MKRLLLFLLTAVAEIVACYLPYLWLRKGGNTCLLVPAAASLALFAWLLTLHPTATGRVYAAYGGVYIAVSLGWFVVRGFGQADALGSARRSVVLGRHGGHHVRAAHHLTTRLNREST